MLRMKTLSDQVLQRWRNISFVNTLLQRHWPVCTTLMFVLDSGAVQLAEKLDGLPLALATAGAYLSQSTFSFTKYLKFFDQSWARLQEMSPALITYEDRTLFSTWQISFDQIERKNSISANLLRLWAYFDNQDLWFELLNHAFNDRPRWMRDLVEDELAFQAAIQVLCDYGLVETDACPKYDVESPGYSVHACVHSWMRTVLNSEYDQILARTALLCVGSHVPKETSSDNFLIQCRLLNHARKCTGYLRGVGDELELAHASSSLGNLYSVYTRLAEAEVMYMRALDIYRNEFGADHLSTLGTTHNLAILYHYQGRIAEAEKMFIEVLKGEEKALGVDHPVTLRVINSLAIIYLEQGRLAEAEEVLILSLKVQERALGVDHPSTLRTIYNLANTYRNRGRTVEAEKMFIQALKGQERALGVDHLLTMVTVIGLSHLYLSWGETKKADQYYRRANTNFERMPPSFPFTLRELGRLLSCSIDYTATSSADQSAA